MWRSGSKERLTLQRLETRAVPWSFAHHVSQKNVEVSLSSTRYGPIQIDVDLQQTFASGECLIVSMWRRLGAILSRP